MYMYMCDTRARSSKVGLVNHNGDLSVCVRLSFCPLPIPESAERRMPGPPLPGIGVQPKKTTKGRSPLILKTL